MTSRMTMISGNSQRIIILKKPLNSYFVAFCGLIYQNLLHRQVYIAGWWKWPLVSLYGVAPSRMVSVSASVNLPLHHKVQKFSSGTASPGWSRKRAVKRLCGVVW